MSFEDVIDEYGTLVWKCRGVSMRPMIHQDTDLVTIIKPVQNPKPMDIALYRRGDGAYVLHRVIGEEGDKYLILGDNCISVEHVPKKNVIGIMKDLTRNGKLVNLDNLGQKMYENLWIKPWRFRVNVLRTKSRLKKAIKKLIRAS